MFPLISLSVPLPLLLTLLSALCLLSIALFLCFYRLLKGPSLPDRVVALDTFSTLSVGILVIFSIVANQPLFLDVALVMTLIYFLGTVAFAYFIEQSQKR